MALINATPPQEVDGDPVSEVAPAVKATLRELTQEFVTYLTAAEVQIANAERSRILRKETSLSAIELAERYDASETAGVLERLKSLTAAVGRVGEQLPEK